MLGFSIKMNFRIENCFFTFFKNGFRIAPSYFSSKHKKCAQAGYEFIKIFKKSFLKFLHSKPVKQIEALRGQRAANENEMSDMHVSFRKYANERKIATYNRPKSFILNFRRIFKNNYDC